MGLQVDYDLGEVFSEKPDLLKTVKRLKLNAV